MSAAGALQNLSRDVASRGIIQKRGAVRLLTDLLLNEKEPKNQVRN